MIKPVLAAQTHGLRHQVLRPHQRPEEMAFPGDEEPGAAHFGYFQGEATIVGIASIHPETLPECPEPEPHYRLRGMAVDPRFQGAGIGQALLKACIDHARDAGAGLLWCNARTGAEPFYRKLGFDAIRGPFDLPGTGPHFLMKNSLLEPDRIP